MDLLLWRHADAQDKDEGSDDLARPLSPRGEKQAARMAAWLDRQLPQGTRIVCSPALRCEQTVRTLGRKYKLRAEIGPDGSVDDLLQMAQWPQSKGAVLVVGHQPALGDVVSQLTGLSPEGGIRKGGLWWLRCREREGVLQTIVVTVQTPEML
ncbi:MAG: histidine phosphatase family protein [Burkholderiaceae bacterium]|nr:histidine phosphatase family protein [Burkholderiaceae bacterium]